MELAHYKSASLLLYIESSKADPVANENLSSLVLN